MPQTSGKTFGCKKQFSTIVSISTGAVMALSGCTGSDSPAATPPSKKPNILFILADDMGFSDLSAFGSEISTPNIDALAANGRILTNHHSGTVSAIARSMLFSGTDHHLAGEGALWYFGYDERQNFPGYEGHLKDSALSIAQLLKDGGYHTYMVGKWDLGDGGVVDPSTGTVRDDPTIVGKSPDLWGFEQTYALMPGAVRSQYARIPTTYDGTNDTKAYFDYSEKGKSDTTAKYVQPHSGEYSTDHWTQKLIAQIESNRVDGKPFFAVASYVAPHWPLQVDAKWSDKFKGVYDAVNSDDPYERTRTQRLIKMKQKGIIPTNAAPFRGAPEVLPDANGLPPKGSTNYQNFVNNLDSQQIYNYGAPGITRTISSTLANYTSTTAASTYSKAKSVKFMSAVKSKVDDPAYVDFGKGLVNKKWVSLTANEKKVQARYMELYAGMVANLDENVRILVKYLKDNGLYDNTMIVFMSDNGPDGFPYDAGLDPYARALPFGTPGADYNFTAPASYGSNGTSYGFYGPALFDRLGTDNGGTHPPYWTGLVSGAAWPYAMYGMRWAEVSASPFAHSKGAMAEGGVRVPCIVHMPGQTTALPPYTGLTHVTDLAATWVDIAGITLPTEKAPVLKTVDGTNKNAGKIIYDNRYVYPITGSSLLPILKANASMNSVIHIEPIGDESYGRAYMFSADGTWKARWQEPQIEMADNPGADDGHWRLFYMPDDPGENNDLSATYPNMVATLRAQWSEYMLKVNGVEPLWPHSYYPYWFTYYY